MLILTHIIQITVPLWNLKLKRSVLPSGGKLFLHVTSSSKLVTIISFDFFVGSKILKLNQGCLFILRQILNRCKAWDVDLTMQSPNKLNLTRYLKVISYGPAQSQLSLCASVIIANEMHEQKFIFFSLFSCNHRPPFFCSCEQRD